MKLSEISKIESAQKQLKTAIKLFFMSGDPISVHALACASQEILESLGKREGIKSLKLQTLDTVDEKDRKAVAQWMNEAKNFFKHADRDPEKVTNLNYQYTELILWDAINTFHLLAKKAIPAFAVYKLWIYLKYPRLCNLNKNEEAMFKEKLKNLTYRDKGHFLNMIFDFENKIREQVKPDSEVIHFNGKDFEHLNTEFTAETNVWSSYFTLNGQGLEEDDEGVIICFYLNNIWSKDITVPQVASVFRESRKNILGFPFVAPDNITKEPAYFIFSYKVRQNHSHLYLTKISSINDSAYSVTYLYKFNGNEETALDKINEWMLKDLQSEEGATRAISNTGVDLSWIKYLLSKM